MNISLIGVIYVSIVACGSFDKIYLNITDRINTQMAFNFDSSMDFPCQTIYSSIHSDLKYEVRIDSGQHLIDTITFSKYKDGICISEIDITEIYSPGITSSIMVDMVMAELHEKARFLHSVVEKIFKSKVYKQRNPQSDKSIVPKLRNYFPSRIPSIVDIILRNSLKPFRESLQELLPDNEAKFGKEYNKFTLNLEELDNGNPSYLDLSIGNGKLCIQLKSSRLITPRNSYEYSM